MNFTKIVCTGNFRKEKFFSIIDHISDFFDKNSLLDKKIELKVSNEFEQHGIKAHLNKKIKIETFDKCIKDCDLIMSIGGDGTILSTVRKLSENQIPILGIHIGNLGFLAQSTEKNLIKALECIKNDDFKIQEKLLLKAKSNNHYYYAFNDIVVDHGNSGRVLKTKVYNDKTHINNYEGDGLIISTPTGSTGYSLSSGGPIIHSDLDVITITPISSHSLSARPIILSSNSNIRVDFSENFIDASLTIDGQVRINLEKNDNIQISKSKFCARLVVLPYYNYFNTLKEKLHWSGNSR